MKRLPLAPITVLNQANPILSNISVTHKPSRNSNTSSDANLMKTENIEEGDFFDNTIGFENLQPVEEGNVFERMERDMDSGNNTPKKSSSTKSSLLKKSIKKDRSTESGKKLKAWFRLRDKRATKGAKAAENSRRSLSSPLNITYNFTPKKLVSQLMSQEDKIKCDETLETSEKENFLASTSTRDGFSSSQGTESKIMAIGKPVDKNVYCLNLIPKEVKKMEISGINVFIGDDYQAYNFSTETKTVKYIV